MIRITERHMVGGRLHEHITEVRWVGIESGKHGSSTRQEMVDWLDKSDGNRAVVGDYPLDYVEVGVWHRANAPDYIRTYANETWTDNLLSLPEY